VKTEMNSGDLLNLLNSRDGRFIYGEYTRKDPLLLKRVAATIPDAGHFMMVDNPDGLYRIIADLIS
jgi:pimeloyl-ACP methyl ester carboxylesterase